MDPLRRLFLISLPSLYFKKALGATSPKKSPAAGWHEKIFQIGLKLRNGDISPADWQKQMEDAMSSVKASELIDYIEFAKYLKYFDAGSAVPVITRIKFPFLGEKYERVLKPRMMTLNKGVINAPHAHFNMTSAHIVLEGEIEALTYDRLAVFDDYCEVRPHQSRVLKQGDILTMSEEKCNIHSLKSLAARSTTLAIPVCNLKPTASLAHKKMAQIGDHIFLFLSKAKRSEAGNWTMKIITEPESRAEFA